MQPKAVANAIAQAMAMAKAKAKAQAKAQAVAIVMAKAMAKAIALANAMAKDMAKAIKPWWVVGGWVVVVAGWLWWWERGKREGGGHGWVPKTQTRNTKPNDPPIHPDRPYPQGGPDQCPSSVGSIVFSPSDNGCSSSTSISSVSVKSTAMISS